MTTNAKVEERHKGEAAGIALMSPGHLRDWIAQHLANLEAARAEGQGLMENLHGTALRLKDAEEALEKARAENADLTNRLAEIDRIADADLWHEGSKDQQRVATIASQYRTEPDQDAALIARLTKAALDAAALTVSYRERGANLDADMVREFSEALGAASDALAKLREIKGAGK